MRILGIDPGHARLGLGLVELDGEEIKFVSYGVIAHPRERVKFNEHLNEGIYQAVVDFPRALHLFKPNLIAAEIVPVGRLGENTELSVAIITVCKVIAFQFGIPWIEFGASTAKKEVTGDGRATKIKVRNTLIEFYPKLGEQHAEMKKQQKRDGIKATGIPLDATDALAIGYTGAKRALKELHEATDSRRQT